MVQLKIIVTEQSYEGKTGSNIKNRNKGAGNKKSCVEKVDVLTVACNIQVK